MSDEVLMLLRLLLACGLGMAIGLERELAGKAAGFRTHTLVCLGAALFTLVSIYAFGTGADIARVAAGVVAGIGFLGAGAIMHREGGSIEGLTTAASIWAVAAIGLAAASGLYWPAVLATALALLLLRSERLIKR
jgi:putative Mg2+ transporter-C (MgtC) family protein